MKQVTPKVFLVGETSVIPTGVMDYLDHINAGDWSSDGCKSDGEYISELMGRSCYRSFGTELNKNITKVTEGNAKYLKNIVKVGHGSVLEHATLNFMICNVSRVFTHELVRHRVGCAISQESLRFVRLDQLGMWAPLEIAENLTAMDIMTRAFKEAEQNYNDLEVLLITPDMPFSEKKKITSAMRRIAPIGLATSIGWSANFRTLRHVIEQRTNPGAEEEIRLVFDQIGEIVTSKYPAVFGDYKTEMVNGYNWYKTESGKI